MTPREIIAGRLAALVDAARDLPPGRGLVRLWPAPGEAQRPPVPWPDGPLYYVREVQPYNADSWPSGLSLPLTAGEALARVEAGAPGILDELDGEISRMAEALVAPELRAVVDLEAVASEWPWPDRRDLARDRSLDALNRVALGPSYRHVYTDSDMEIAEWAAARLEASLPEYAGELRRWGGEAPFPLLSTWRNDAGRWPAAGLVLLWCATRDACCRAYALDAAADVRAELARLVDARDPSPEIFDALDVATEGEPLAAGIDASTRGGWAGALLTLAQGVARDVLALDVATEDDARAAAAAAAGVLADALAKLGTAGREKAAEARTNADARARKVRAGELLAGELWGPWRRGGLWPSAAAPAGWLRALARVLWADVWRPERERERIRPAVTARIGRTILNLHSPATAERTMADGVELVTVTGQLAGRIELDDITRTLIARRGTGTVVPADEARRAATELVRARATTAAVFTFLHAIRTVTGLVRRGDDRLRERWDSWNAWVEEVAACYDVKPTPQLRRLLCNAAWFGNAVQVPLFDGRTQRGLWTLTAPDPFKPGRPKPSAVSDVVFSYAPIFAPAWADLENPKDRNRGVRLMAIPDRLPVGVPNPAIRGPLYLFSLDVIAEVTLAPVPDRGVRLDGRLQDLARGAGLDDDDAKRQLDALLRDGADHGSILELAPGNRYRLADEDARTLSAPRLLRKSR